MIFLALLVSTLNEQTVVAPETSPGLPLECSTASTTGATLT